jgi:hypothetical protein
MVINLWERGEQTYEDNLQGILDFSEVLILSYAIGSTLIGENNDSPLDIARHKQVITLSVTF